MNQVVNFKDASLRDLQVRFPDGTTVIEGIQIGLLISGIQLLGRPELQMLAEAELQRMEVDWKLIEPSAELPTGLERAARGRSKQHTAAAKKRYQLRLKKRFEDLRAHTQIAEGRTPLL